MGLSWIIYVHQLRISFLAPFRHPKGSCSAATRASPASASRPWPAAGCWRRTPRGSTPCRRGLAQGAGGWLEGWKAGENSELTHLDRIWLFYRPIEIDGLPFKNGDFPWPCCLLLSTTERGVAYYMGLSENRVYSQWNSHLIGIMISKTIGYNGVYYFQTHPFGCLKFSKESEFHLKLW